MSEQNVKQTKMSEENVRQTKISWLQDWSRTTKFIVIGIIVQSFLQSIADSTIEKRSKYKILYWLIILLVFSLLFIFIEYGLNFVDQKYIAPASERYQHLITKQTNLSHTLTANRIRIFREWTNATRLIIIGIILNSILESIAETALPENSSYKILFWFGVLLFTTLFFACFDTLLRLIDKFILDPIIDNLEIKYNRKHTQPNDEIIKSLHLEHPLVASH